jgi:hypothetical protein
VPGNPISEDGTLPSYDNILSKWFDFILWLFYSTRPSVRLSFFLLMPVLSRESARPLTVSAPKDAPCCTSLPQSPGGRRMTRGQGSRKNRVLLCRQTSFVTNLSSTNCFSPIFFKGEKPTRHQFCRKSKIVASLFTLCFSDMAVCVIGIINGFAEKLKSIMKDCEATTFSLLPPPPCILHQEV